MPDRTTVILLTAVNVLAIAAVYNRLATEGLLPTVDSILQHAKLLKPGSCGLLPQSDFTLSSSRVMLPEGIHPATIRIINGKIFEIQKGVHSSSEGVINLGTSLISPGVIDVHAHLNEPGRESWEGMATGTRAAAAGGITTIMDMPLNSDPVTTTVEQLNRKKARAQALGLVNIGFWAGLVPANAADHSVLQALLDAGASGFKSFMCPSGIDDFAHVGREDIAAALPFFIKAGVPFYVHAEMVPPTNEKAKEQTGDGAQYATYLATRPVDFERNAIYALIEELRTAIKNNDAPKPGFRVHIAHLGDVGSLSMIEAAKNEGLPLTVETCPHYISFSAEDVQTGHVEFKCAPPLRDASNKAGLIEAVASGHIDLIGSDHSPAPPELKHLNDGNFLKAWGGISGLQYLLPATWSVLRAQNASLERLTVLLSGEPAKLAGVDGSKGRIAVGMDADLVVWDPEAPADTSTAKNYHRHKLSPYTDIPLMGKVLSTFVNGRKVYDVQGGFSPKPCGSLVLLEKK